MSEHISLLDYANDREYVVLFWSSVGTPTGSSVPLGYPDLDFADRNGLLELTGTVNESDDWQWDGEGHPTDDQRNTITRLTAYETELKWNEIVAEYEAGD